MIEGAGIRVDSSGYGIKLTSDETIFAKSIGKIRAAVCPKCGEISLYVEEVDKLEKTSNDVSEEKE